MFGGDVSPSTVQNGKRTLVCKLTIHLSDLERREPSRAYYSVASSLLLSLVDFLLATTTRVIATAPCIEHGLGKKNLVYRTFHILLLEVVATVFLSISAEAETL